MAYTIHNFKTAKQVKLAFAQGNTLMCFQPGPFPLQTTGVVCLEGPHYPKPHSWYLSATLDDNGCVTGLKSGNKIRDRQWFADRISMAMRI